jgi:signal transduction histidine kinase/DNA-binding response OmpR family regulator
VQVRNLPSNSGRISLAAAALAAAIGLVVLMGWWSGDLKLTRVLPGLTAMNPMTAVALLALAIAVALSGRVAPWWVRAIALPPIAIGGAKLVQLGFGVNLRVDQLLFDDKLALLRDVAPNRMAPNTAIALIMLGLSLMAGTWRAEKFKVFAQTIAFAVAGLTSFAMIGHLLRNEAFYRVGNFNEMALNTAVALFAISTSIIFIHREMGVMRIIGDSGPAGFLARTTLPLALMVPVLVGYLRLLGEKRGLYDTYQGVAIMITANILFTFAVLMASLTVLYRSDRERRMREIAVTRSEERYRLVESVGRIGHWRIELPSGAASWSSALYSMCGIPHDTPPNPETLRSLYSLEDADESRREWQRLLETGEAIESKRHIMRPDGEQRHITSYSSCERDENGAIAALFGVFVDVTELELARQAAEDAAHAKAAFLANMSHEIRTPMNGVMGFAELLLSAPLKPEQKRQASLILESGRALLKLLNDILDVSKIDAGQMEVACEPFTIRHGVGQCIDLMRPMASQKGLAIHSDIEPDLPYQIMGDGLRVRQILLNLLGNAIKFTKEGFVNVEIGANHEAETGPQVIYRVSDTGVGIPPERINAVFDEFVQADASISRRFGGSGLGLSISRRLANLMGGSITLANREGGGTVATLILPLQPAEDRTSPDISNLGMPGEAFTMMPQRTVSILLVEDIDINRELVSAILTRLGHKVQFAENGAEALAKAARLEAEPGAWDLVLMDVHMPIMDGLTATKAIRQLGGRAATIPIIALSAGAFASEVQECLDSGMNDHLAKPIAIEELAAAVSRWTGQRVCDPSESDAPHSALMNRFEERRRNSAEALAQLTVKLGSANAADLHKILAEAVEIAHVLAGSAGMFGQAALGQAARDVENELRSLQEEGDGAQDETHKVIGKLISALGSEAT